eukprot:Sspe_Gene.1287::Locus_435_Transcript_1_1_Confidence_1.000_Length_1649::g.1287::m.1287
MALRRTPPRWGLKQFVADFIGRNTEFKAYPERWELRKTREGGDHWLEWRYTPKLYQVFWYNMIRVRWSGEVLVGKDWRDNLFFVKVDPSHPMGHVRFARFIEPWQITQDYDTDQLWKLWLEYRTPVPPSPRQCAQSFKYQESKYKLRELFLQKRAEMFRKDPPEDMVRRYMEYRDMKYDIRLADRITKKAMMHKWVWTRNKDTELQEKTAWAQALERYEAWNFFNLDLLRPPSRQRLWKLEEDIRSWKFFDKIENPNYLMDPYKKSGVERYMLTPSYVAGEPVPAAVKGEENPLSVGYMNRGKYRVKPIDFMRVSEQNPFPHFPGKEEFDQWFSEQRKELVIARGELEQMKREGYRPLAVGGDLDPYQLSKTLPDPVASREEQVRLLDEARAERNKIEELKAEAARRLLSQGEEGGAGLVIKTFETAVKTEEFGALKAGDAARFREGSLEFANIEEIEMEGDVEPSGRAAAVSVFGGKAKSLFTTVNFSDDSGEEEGQQEATPKPAPPGSNAPDLK